MTRHYTFYTLHHTLYKFLGSIVVSIPACHAGDGGSIPRRGGCFAYYRVFGLTQNTYILYYSFDFKRDSTIRHFAF